MKPAALITVLLSSLAFVACDKHDVEVEIPGTDERVEMSFSAKVSQETETKAATSLEQSFLVFAWAEEESLMNGYAVRKNSSQQWTYDDNGDQDYDDKAQELKHWDWRKKWYIFSAVSPLPKENDVTASVDADKKLSLTNVTADVGTNIDWLAARTKRTTAMPKDEDALDTTHKFPSLNSPTEAVPLNFHHILSQIVFKIFAYEDDIAIPNLEVEIGEVMTKGDYSNPGSGLGSWSNQTTPSTLEIFKGAKILTTTPTELKTLCVIPQPLVTGEPGATTAAKISVKTGANATFELDGEWEINKRYIYSFKVNAPDNIILINVNVDDWAKNEGADPEGEVNNW